MRDTDSPVGVLDSGFVGMVWQWCGISPVCVVVRTPPAPRRLAAVESGDGPERLLAGHVGAVPGGERIHPSTIRFGVIKKPDEKTLGWPWNATPKRTPRFGCPERSFSIGS